MSTLIDLTGQSFGRLTVLERATNSKNGQAYWLCECKCGTVKTVRGTHLTSSRTVSCGCHSRDVHLKHGKSRSPEYRAYYNMIKRCEYEGDNRYADYGGRGIRVCVEWRASFERFLADMGLRPGRDYSIDRIDVNGNYEPGNCRWAVKEVQEHNKRTRSDSSSGVRGVVVRFDTKGSKYVAQIYVNGKTKRIGTFRNREAARKARREAEKKYWTGGGAE